MFDGREYECYTREAESRTNAVTRSVAKHAKAPVTLWSEYDPNTYRAEWYDADSETFNQAKVTIL